jgi:transglutaminase-like putative cysteine protease
LKKSILIMLAVALALLPLGCSTTTASSPGEQLLAQARQQQEEANYTKAESLFKQAWPLLAKEGKTAQATECRNGVQTVQMFLMTYAASEEQVKKALEEAYPWVPAATRASWITSGELEHTKIDGRTRYFIQAVDNVATRHLEVVRGNAAKQQTLLPFMTDFLKTVVEVPPPPPGQPYMNPASWSNTGTVTVPRKDLPENGLFKVWIPVPIQTGPQQPVSVTVMTPGGDFRQPASIASDIGLAYAEIPLGPLQGDLNLSVQYNWTHFEQRFSVDPKNVGSYDRSSTDYKTYTRSNGNTRITPAIRRTAVKVVGSEKNPYLKAKKLYDYVVADIRYSFMPHATLWPRGEPESVYVHNMKRGDCGAQSMYFSALCRSVGIPARTTGGYQLLMGPCADHFWAEFLLPNYGWVPADVTAAEMGDWVKDVTEQQRKEYKDLFFANQDNRRCVIQLDTDEPLIPPATAQVFLPLAVQAPAAECATMIEPAAALVMEGWNLSSTKL